MVTSFQKLQYEASIVAQWVKMPSSMTAFHMGAGQVSDTPLPIHLHANEPKSLGIYIHLGDPDWPEFQAPDFGPSPDDCSHLENGLAEAISLCLSVSLSVITFQANLKNDSILQKEKFHFIVEVTGKH